MGKSQAIPKLRITNYKSNALNLYIRICVLFVICNLFFVNPLLFAQPNENLEFNLDANSNTIPLPNIFKPNMDLSGRGVADQKVWPQNLASPEVLDVWGKEIGFKGLYRIQYNLWEIYELAKDKSAQDKLLENYESIIKKISDSGGIVILNVFGTPAGLGKVLDKKSPVIDYRAYKALIKNHMRTLSCNKRYSVWYEVWNAPDLDDFFLGRKAEYLNLYRAMAESAKELENETKIHIPVGGPSISWWFQNLDGNSIISPEHSLIYDLIKFCYGYRLPIDFITWHAYSTDPKPEIELTRYKKTPIGMIRDWLSYFRFDRNTPLIIDEWNYDSGANILPARREKANIASSYIISRIKGMYEAGIDNQAYFSIEDFHNEKENVIRNVGVFLFDPESSKYKSGPKAVYNAFRMLNMLGRNMFFSSRLEDEFTGVVATKNDEDLILIVYNYADPMAAFDYISKNISRLSDSERKFLINMIKSNEFEKIISGKKDTAVLRTTKRIRTLIKKAQELNSGMEKFSTTNRNIKINIKNATSTYSYQRYAIDDSCAVNCDFSPVEQKDLNIPGNYQEMLSVKPYSVNLLVFTKKIQQPTAIENTGGTAETVNMTEENKK